jgi:2-desacetyl-2-hydroxyethyl bacteriochlorophyllide A dehydrogenase
MLKAEAVVFTAPNQVEFKDVECPDPTDDDIVVRVEQSWISNGTEGSYLRGERSDGDRPFVEGDPPPFPVVAGYQKTGQIEWIGKNITEFEVGERVFATIGRVSGMHHWYAGQVSPSVCPRDHVWKIPPTVAPLEICPLVLMQVGFNAGTRPDIRPGETAVVVGDGLVGHWTAQTLASRGAKVVMVGRHDERLAALEEFPGGVTINSRNVDWIEALQEIGIDGIKVAVDTVGSIEVLEEMASLMPRFGHLVSAGFYGRDDRLALQPPRYGEHTIHLVSGWTRPRMDATIESLKSGVLRASHLLTHQFPVHEADKAWELIESKKEHVLGVVLDWT